MFGKKARMTAEAAQKQPIAMQGNTILFFMFGPLSIFGEKKNRYSGGTGRREISGSEKKIKNRLTFTG